MDQILSNVDVFVPLVPLLSCLIPLLLSLAIILGFVSCESTILSRFRADRGEIGRARSLLSNRTHFCGKWTFRMVSLTGHGLLLALLVLVVLSGYYVLRSTTKFSSYKTTSGSEYVHTPFWRLCVAGVNGSSTIRSEMVIDPDQDLPMPSKIQYWNSSDFLPYDLPSNVTSCSSINGTPYFYPWTRRVEYNDELLDRRCCQYPDTIHLLASLPNDYELGMATECYSSEEWANAIPTPMDQCEFWDGTAVICPIQSIVAYERSVMLAILPVFLGSWILVGLLCPVVCVIDHVSIQAEACGCFCQRDLSRVFFPLPKFVGSNIIRGMASGCGETFSCGSVKKKACCPILEEFTCVALVMDSFGCNCLLPLYVWFTAFWKFWMVLACMVCVIGLVSISSFGGLFDYANSIHPGVECRDYITKLRSSCSDYFVDAIEYDDLEYVVDSGLCGDGIWPLLIYSAMGVFGLCFILYFFSLSCAILWSKFCSARIVTNCPVAKDNWEALTSGEMNLDPSTLHLLFDHDAGTKCFCGECSQLRGEENETFTFHNRQKVALPKGWTRFATRISGSDRSRRVSWWNAYHGTSCVSAAAILNNGGELLMPGDILPSGVALEIPEGHVNDPNWTKRVFMSPSIIYASAPQFYARPFLASTSAGKQQYQVVFEVNVKPRTELDPTFVIERETLPGRGQIDPDFLNICLEWATNRRNVVVITAVLVRRYDTKFGDVFLNRIKKSEESELRNVEIDGNSDITSDDVQQEAEAFQAEIEGVVVREIEAAKNEEQVLQELHGIRDEPITTRPEQSLELVDAEASEILQSPVELVEHDLLQSVVDVEPKDPLPNRLQTFLPIVEIPEEQIEQTSSETEQRLDSEVHSLQLEPATESVSANVTEVLQDDEPAYETFMAGLDDGAGDEFFKAAKWLNRYRVSFSFCVATLSIVAFAGAIVLLYYCITIATARFAGWESAYDYFVTDNSNVDIYCCVDDAPTTSELPSSTCIVALNTGCAQPQHCDLNRMVDEQYSSGDTQIFFGVFLFSVGGIIVSLFLQEIWNRCYRSQLLKGTGLQQRISPTAWIAPPVCIIFAFLAGAVFSGAFGFNSDPPESPDLVELTAYLSTFCGDAMGTSIKFNFMKETWNSMYPTSNDALMWSSPFLASFVLLLMLQAINLLVSRLLWRRVGVVCSHGTRNILALLSPQIGLLQGSSKLLLDFSKTQCFCEDCKDENKSILHSISGIVTARFDEGEKTEDDDKPFHRFTRLHLRIGGFELRRGVLNTWQIGYIPFRLTNELRLQIRAGKLLHIGDVNEVGSVIGIRETEESSGRVFVESDFSRAQLIATPFFIDSLKRHFRLVIEVRVAPEAFMPGRMSTERRNVVVLSGFYIANETEERELGEAGEVGK